MTNCPECGRKLRWYREPDWKRGYYELRCPKCHQYYATKGG